MPLFACFPLSDWISVSKGGGQVTRGTADEDGGGEPESASDRAARIFALLAILVVIATIAFVAWIG